MFVYVRVVEYDNSIYCMMFLKVLRYLMLRMMIVYFRVIIMYRKILADIMKLGTENWDELY